MRRAKGDDDDDDTGGNGGGGDESECDLRDEKFKRKPLMVVSVDSCCAADCFVRNERTNVPEQNGILATLRL